MRRCIFPEVKEGEYFVYSHTGELQHILLLKMFRGQHLGTSNIVHVMNLSNDVDSKFWKPGQAYSDDNNNTVTAFSSMEDVYNYLTNKE